VKLIRERLNLRFSWKKQLKKSKKTWLANFNQKSTVSNSKWRKRSR